MAGGTDDGREAGYLPELRLVLRLLSPARAEAIISYLDDRSARRQRRIEEMADAAESEAGEPFAALLGRAQSDDDRSDLANDVLSQAADAASAWKIRALGRALALGLLASDDAAIDEVRLMVRAMRDLESPHVRILHHLYVHRSRHDGTPDAELASMFPNGVRVVYTLLKTLERHGLAGPVPPRVIDGGAASGEHDEYEDPAQEWEIWDFGALLVERLLAYRVGRPE
jgi:hypothetical protein